MIRILVTGASGFIGQYFMALQGLASGRSRLQVLQWPRRSRLGLLDETTWRPTLAETKPDALVHFAWRHTGLVNYENDEANRYWGEATCALAEYTASAGVRFVGVGSAIEDDPGVHSEYANAKRSVSQTIGVLAAQGYDVAWIKPSWVFDFAALRPRVLFEREAALRRGVDFHLRTPEESLDFIHVWDVAVGVALTAVSRFIGKVPVRSGRSMSVGRFVFAFDEWKDKPYTIERSSQFQKVQSVLTGGRSSEDPMSVGWAPWVTKEFLERYW